MRLFTYCVFLLISMNLCAQSADTSRYLILDSMISLSMSLVEKREFDGALKFGKQTLDTSVAMFGEESAAYAHACLNYGRVFRFKGDLDQAEFWYLKALPLYNKLHGKEHRDYAQTLYSLAALYVLKNDLPKAENYFKESMQIRKKVLGEDHPDIYYNLTSLTDLHYKKGQYSEAMIYIEELLSRKEKRFGSQHPTFASSLIWRGLLKSSSGKESEAIKDYLQARTIFESTTGKDDPEYANCLNNIAITYWQMGDLDKVEPLLNEIIEIREKTFGQKHPTTIRTKMNLAIYHLETGNYKKAEPLFIEAKELLKQSLGARHPDYARCLNNLAGLYNRQSKYHLVLPLYLEQLEIQENTIGTGHPDYAISLTNLGQLYETMGDYVKAEELVMQALKIRKTTLGVHHHEYAYTIRTLGRLYSYTKRYKEADSLLNQACLILEHALGKEHNEYLIALFNLALFYKETGNTDRAQQLFGELAELNQAVIQKSIFHLSEEEIKQYKLIFSDRRREIYKLAEWLQKEDAGIHGVAYDQALFEKGFLLQVRDRLRRLSQIVPDFNDMYNAYQQKQSKLLVEMSNPEQAKNITAMDSLKAVINNLEQAMARKSLDYGKSIQQIRWKDVSNRLMEGEASIEFIRYSDSDTMERQRYAAVIIKKGSAFPRFMSLCAESSLDSLLFDNRNRKSEYVNILYSLKERGVSQAKGKRRTLYELLWKPMEHELSDIRKIYFSPEGLLHRINMDAIPVNETESLADKYALVCLNSTRQLVVPYQTEVQQNNAILFGGIQYDPDTTLNHDKQLLAARSENTSPDKVSFEEMESWEYLAGTQKEVRAIGKILTEGGYDANVYQEYSATEDTFKFIGFQMATGLKFSPRVIHIATHGYFFSDAVNSSEESLSKAKIFFKYAEHPMVRSGLIMASANTAWKGNPIPDGREDGILTAYEISQMNLSNTELVVLSACETGLGDIQGNEGVYGLQRAFKIAGAKYIIMSLWQVPDKQTSMLMITFYKKWLEEKMSIPDAFRAAQKELRDFGLDPYQWAGFVLVE